MDDLAVVLNKSLLDSYNLNFQITELPREKLVRKFLIQPSEGNDNYFDIMMTVNGDVRLTIECYPSKFGKSFLDLINNSTIEEKNIFCAYWDTLLNEKSNKVSVKINEIPIGKKEFLSEQNEWEKFSIRFTKLAFAEDESEYFTVIPKYLVIICGMMLSLISRCLKLGHEEGSVKEVTVKKYERNPANRELCLFVKGYKCAVCGFDFEKTYGVIGKKYIEVHHIVPVSELGEHYILDPIKDLVPLCSNCHSMAHRRNPPYSVMELQEFIKQQQN